MSVADTLPARVELVSPIPPMRTGTADYLDHVVRRLVGLPATATVARIAIDPDFMDDTSPPPSDLHGVPVCDYRSLDAEVPLGSTRIYFLANNDHHAYAYMMLERQRSLAYGRTICVIHDPAAFMLHRFRTGNGCHRIDDADLHAAVEAQYGPVAKRLLDARLAGDMPDIFEFVTHCQGTALAHSHEIWVHSLYGAAKLLCESQMPLHRFPRIRLCSHPHAEAAASPQSHPPQTPTPDKLRIGAFGWITPPKRVTSVIRGLALALDRLGPGAADQIELVVVGRKPPESTYDPATEAARFDLERCVRFFDYPSASVFSELQTSCRLIFNLRYPSCGETSGTLASALGTEARVITSRYQAFNEADGSADSVTALPPFDEWTIAASICSAFDDHRHGQRARPAERRHGTATAPVEKLVAEQILRAAQRHRIDLNPVAST